MTTALSRRLGDRLAIDLPIIQAPMAGVSIPAQAAVVSNAEDLASIAVTNLEEARRGRSGNGRQRRPARHRLHHRCRVAGGWRLSRRTAERGVPAYGDDADDLRPAGPLPSGGNAGCRTRGRIGRGVNISGVPGTAATPSAQECFVPTASWATVGSSNAGN